MEAQPFVFDLHLLHLPPINLHNIGMYYRYPGEFFDQQPANDIPSDARPSVARQDAQAVIVRTLKHR